MNQLIMFFAFAIVVVNTAYFSWIFNNYYKPDSISESDVSMEVISKKTVEPIAPEVKTPSPLETPVVAQAVNADRCFYKNQSYTPGDILKTDGGWIRCTPTVAFSVEKPETKIAGNPAWTIVQ